MGPFERVLVRRFTNAELTPYKKTGFIKARINTLGNLQSSNNFFFVTMKDRQNFIPQLTQKFGPQSITVSTNRLASYVWIYRKKGNNYLPLKL